MKDRNQKENRFICPWCNHYTVFIWVHGHGQCYVCGINIDECCRGESCQPSMESSSIQKEEIEPEN